MNKKRINTGIWFVNEVEILYPVLATDILDMNNFEIFDINNRKLHKTMKCFI